MINPVALTILESSQAGEARRKAIAFTSRLGFNQTEQGKVGLIVTELANNLVRHAKEGQLILQALETNSIAGVEILSLDKGPGIDDLDECLRDGFSTTGTSGHGLGAISRLSAVFDIYSLPEVGTACLAQLWSSPLPTNGSNDRMKLGVVCLPKVGEEVSGDAWASYQEPNRSVLLVVDGLGHGPSAAEASLSAVRIFQENTARSSSSIIEAAHGALRSTRGAAMAVAELDFELQTVRFAGIGNICGIILASPRNHNMVSHNGTVGYELRKIQEFSYPWTDGSILVMHSDGLKTQWRLDRYPGLITKHPSLIAGILYRDFNRERDDVTVLVASEWKE